MLDDMDLFVTMLCMTLSHGMCPVAVGSGIKAIVSIYYYVVIQPVFFKQI